MTSQSIIQTFTAQAEAVSTRVFQVSDVSQALGQVVEACVHKEACTLLASGCEEDLSPQAADLCALKEWSKVMALPGLDPKIVEPLIPDCREKGIRIIQRGLRGHLGGIDIGVTWAEQGIADTGTVVIDSSREDLRLAGMISEIHAVLLPAAAIFPDLAALSAPLQASFQNAPNYTSFITGASRTADIERVLTLGVHGPLEVHIYIVEDASHADSK